MSSEGCGISVDAVLEFNEMKVRKKYPYLLYTISADFRQIELAGNLSCNTPYFKFNDDDEYEIIVPPNVLHYGDFERLAKETHRIIFQFCTARELCSFSSTCKTFYCAIMNRKVWDTSTRYHLSQFIHDPMSALLPKRAYETTFKGAWKNYYQYLRFSSKNAQSPDTATPAERWHFFTSFLPPTDCRFGVCWFGFHMDEGFREILLFVLWAPEAASIKSRMIHAGNKDTLKKRLQGVQAEVQLVSEDELNYYNVAKEIKQKLALQ